MNKTRVSKNSTLLLIIFLSHWGWTHFKFLVLLSFVIDDISGHIADSLGDFSLTVPVCDQEEFVFAKMAFGDYPVEYNPSVHGPYDPARFYGKRKYLYFNVALHKKKPTKIQHPLTLHNQIDHCFFFFNWFMFFRLAPTYFNDFLDYSRHPIRPDQGWRDHFMAGPPWEEPKSSCWLHKPCLVALEPQIRAAKARRNRTIPSDCRWLDDLLLCYKLWKDQ